MKNRPTIIGIDGGASKVSAHIILASEDDQSFTLSDTHSVKEYRNYSMFNTNFIPVNITTQLKQIENENIVLTPAEEQQSQAYFNAFVDAISELSALIKTDNILIGIGMPGIKTADKCGIAAMANGPRMPEFADEIEQRLGAANITLAVPISKLGSDADYCGIGEEYAENGSFRSIENAYYLGGGTGAADALKLHWKLIPFDKCKDWIAKTWEMSDENGLSMERYCSANGIQSVYGNISGISQSELNKNKVYLDQILVLANKDNNAAIATWQIVSKNLADLIFERISTIYTGSQNNHSFANSSKVPLDSNHNYENTLLYRIIIGQRLGELLQNPMADKYLGQPLFNHLSLLISKSEFLDDHAKSHYLKSGKFDNNIIAVSQLREAPALGAGIDAFRNFKL